MSRAPRQSVRRNEVRRICFATGTRAEFGLMESTLRAIGSSPKLSLGIIATGMHLDRERGHSLRRLRAEGWTIGATVPWKQGDGSPADAARATGRAVAGFTDVFERLDPDIVLVVGDRVEAFAAATAAHLSGRIVAHVHGGDRALGQSDDALRHAITKLSHIHFPATADSAARLRRLGEEPFRIHRVGSPGIDGIKGLAASRQRIATVVGDWPPRRFALVVLHPESSDEALERRRAISLLTAVRAAGVGRIAIIFPNTDPGARGILHAWTAHAGDADVRLIPDAPRDVYLGLLRDAAVLVGNSSSGIIEAASFGTFALDIGDRQSGRQRSGNVIHVPHSPAAIAKALRPIWNRGVPKRFRGTNVYGGGAVGTRIADVLARIALGERLRHKLIAH